MPYYQGLCKKLYKNRYLHEDLFQEFYLTAIEIPQEKVNNYSTHLKYLLSRTIKDLFAKRCRNSSTLTELSNSIELTELIPTTETDFETENKKEIALKKIKSKLKKSLAGNSEEWASATVLILAQNQNFVTIARNSKINEREISKLYKKCLLNLQNEIRTK